MFRPCKWAIIRLFTELVRRLYTRRGGYLGDEIPSYIIVLRVNAGYQRFIYVCTCHLKCMPRLDNDYACISDDRYIHI